MRSRPVPTTDSDSFERGRRCGRPLSSWPRSESAAHLTADRCADSLRRAAGSLARAAELNRGGRGEELIGSELRVALTELSSVVGAVYTEDILGRIFSRFCIGK